MNGQPRTQSGQRVWPRAPWEWPEIETKKFDQLLWNELLPCSIFSTVPRWLLPLSPLSLQVKIWFQNRRTKWKKQDNISNTEAAEHKTTTTSKNSNQQSHDTKSNCTSSPPPDSPIPLQPHMTHHSTPLGSGKQQMNGAHHPHFGTGSEKKHSHHHHSSSASSSKYKQKVSREEALYKTQSPAAAAAYLPHHNPLFSLMAGHHPLGMDHSLPHSHDVEARLAASKISLSAFSKVGQDGSHHGMELSPMLSIGAMNRLPRPWNKDKVLKSCLKRKKTKRKTKSSGGQFDAIQG